MKKVLKFILKFIVGIFSIVISLLLIIVILFNIIKFPIYAEYYSIKTDICVNPGLNDGFICQGITACEDENKFFVSGYMKDKSNSRIYITNVDNESYYVKLIQNGELFNGHVGGIATTNGNVYLANDNKVYVFTVNDLINAKPYSNIEIGDGIEVNNSASFIYTDDKYIYVGEFHDGGKYVTNHIYETNDGEYHAIVSRYDVDDLTKPNLIYSIRNKVQGICFTPDNRVILSTSYGLASSTYYIYDLEDSINSGNTLDGAPVYYLDNVKKEIKGPAMSECLDYYDGKVITLTESASNKYIFGKLFFANYIVGLDF